MSGDIAGRFEAVEEFDRRLEVIKSALDLCLARIVAVHARNVSLTVVKFALNIAPATVMASALLHGTPKLQKVPRRNASALELWRKQGSRSATAACPRRCAELDRSAMA
jgi:hypothetical protein